MRKVKSIDTARQATPLSDSRAMGDRMQPRRTAKRNAAATTRDQGDTSAIQEAMGLGRIGAHQQQARIPEYIGAGLRTVRSDKRDIQQVPNTSQGKVVRSLIGGSHVEMTSYGD